MDFCEICLTFIAADGKELSVSKSFSFPTEPATRPSKEYLMLDLARSPWYINGRIALYRHK